MGLPRLLRPRFNLHTCSSVAHALLPLLPLLPLIAAPSIAHAEIFKWIDEKGVVNYGDQPPERVKNARPLDAATSTLSVVPGLPADVLQREHERTLEGHIAQLERDLSEQRMRAALSSSLSSSLNSYAPAADLSDLPIATRLYSHPAAWTHPIPPHRPHLRARRDDLQPPLVRAPDHR